MIYSMFPHLALEFAAYNYQGGPYGFRIWKIKFKPTEHYLDLVNLNGRWGKFGTHGWLGTV